MAEARTIAPGALNVGGGSFTLQGVEAFLRALKATDRQVVKASKIALRKEGDAIMRRSQAEFVPYDRRILLGSGRVQTAVVGSEVVTTLSFGGDAMDYALAVHETPSKHDPPSWKKAWESGGKVHFKHGGPKYLERPVKEAQAGMAERLAGTVAASAWKQAGGFTGWGD